MGQYFQIVNLTKKEYLDPHKCASGLKFFELLAADPPTKILGFLLRLSNEGGGGDIDTTGKKYVGRWAGDSIVIVGDYDRSNIYEKCIDTTELKAHNKWLIEQKRDDEILTKKDLFKDISDKVIKEYNDFIEIEEYQVDLKSTGWRDTIKTTKESKLKSMRPDMVIRVGNVMEGSKNES